ncbi:MAG: hypothetical protein DDT22_00289 [candidate division WS2 bacterium]|nr:hypothetical protein [Candidatus Lithacetigena glycinireducens]MBT9174629.1 hypothetical protein [Candidatus Lithacetigena glycinireducens]
MIYIAFLSFLILILIYRLVKSPTSSDSILIIEVMGNITISIIGLLALVKNLSYLMDVLIIMVFANFLVIVGFGRFLQNYHDRVENNRKNHVK